MILKYTVLILLMAKIAVSYRQYKYSELCPPNKFKTMFDTMTDNRPVVRLSDGHGSAALVRYYSDKSIGKKMGSCEFNVKLDQPSSSQGIFASIKKLKLRENTYDGSCKDFLRFTYKNGTSTRKICGNIETSVHNNMIRNFFDETTGELRVEISIDTSYSTMDDYNELEVSLVFTAYSNCSGTSLLYCSPEKCISDIFQNDEILNCPPPGCLDESNCVNNEKPVIVSVGSKSGPSGAAHIYIPIVIICVAGLCLICFCKKKKAQSNNNQTPTAEHVEELRPTARTDLDSYLQFQDVRIMPMVPEPTHYRPLPYDPVDEHRGPMPMVPPDQRYDRPMPSAPPPSGYRDEPPAYDALFNKNQNPRTNV